MCWCASASQSACWTRRSERIRYLNYSLRMKKPYGYRAWIFVVWSANQKVCGIRATWSHLK